MMSNSLGKADMIYTKNQFDCLFVDQTKLYFRDSIFIALTNLLRHSKGRRLINLEYYFFQVLEKHLQNQELLILN